MLERPVLVGHWAISSSSASLITATDDMAGDLDRDRRRPAKSRALFLVDTAGLLAGW